MLNPSSIQEHVSEHDWSSGWVILSMFAHQAHLAQSYFSLIFTAFNAYNCSWFLQTNNNLQWLKTKACWKVTNAYDFFPHGDSRHYWYFKYQVCQLKLRHLNTFLQFRLLFHKPHCMQLRSSSEQLDADPCQLMKCLNTLMQ